MKTIAILDLNNQVNLALNYIPNSFLQKKEIAIEKLTLEQFEQLGKTSKIDNYHGIFLSYERPDTELESKIEEIIANYNAIPIYVFYNSSSSKQQPEQLEKKIQRWCEKEFRGGVIDTAQPAYHLIPSIIQLLEGVSRKDLIQINQQVSDIHTQFDNEIMKIKQIHGQIVPKRFDEIKGIKILSKYGIGSSSGGDFFDIAHNNSNLTFLMTSAKSYLATSIILASFSNFKTDNDLSPEASIGFLENLEEQLSKLAQSQPKNTEIELLFLNINLKDLSVSGFSFGNNIIYGNTKLQPPTNTTHFAKALLKDTRFKSTLERGDKFLLLSPGLMRNLSNDEEISSIFQKIRSQISDNSVDLLNNIFVDLLQTRNSNILNHDAFAVVVEVKPNVIIQT